MKDLNNICEDLAEENRSLKDELAEKQEIIDKIMIKKDGNYENSLLKERNPSFYDELVKKKGMIK